MLGPQDAWLALRGMKTLALRLDRAQQNAARLADWLRGQEAEEKVSYAGWPEHPGYTTHIGQSGGAGAMLSFTVREAALVAQVLEQVRLISFAESLGGLESLITFPARQTHADIPSERRERLGVTERLLRLSVGIEAAEDLIADIAQAMN